MKMKKLLTMILAVAFAFGVFVPLASAKNYDVSFTLVPNGDSKFSGKGKKGDAEPRCYVTTEEGTVIENKLRYRVRGRAIEGSTYVNATQLSSRKRGKVTGLKLGYIDPYLTEIKSGKYAKHYYILAASLHDGDPNKTYTLKGKWNP